MILILDKAWNPGDADPGVTYDHLHVEYISYDSTGWSVNINAVYGTLDQNKQFHRGAASPMVGGAVTGQALDTMQTAMSKASEPILPGAMRLAYEYLIAEKGVSGKLSYELPADPSPPDATAQKGPTP